MKRKHFPLISAGLFLVSIIGAILYTMVVGGKVTKEIRVKMVKNFPTIPVPAPAAVKEMEELGNKVKGLSQPNISQGDRLNLSLFGYRRREREGSVNVYGDIGTNHYSLTLAFASGKNRYCVIDGAFYPEGGKLPDGGRVARIRRDKVLIVKRGLRVWVSLKDKK